MEDKMLLTQEINRPLHNEQYFHDLFSLKGKTAVVTGASSGLGKQIATVFARAGANIVLIARREALLKDYKNELESLGVKVFINTADLSNIDELKRSVKEILSHVKKIDILVNSAGCIIRLETPNGQLEDIEKGWEQQVNTNSRAVYFLTKLIADHMRENKILGSIINIASVRGDRCPASGSAIYSASKAAVIQLSRALAMEYAKFSIRVNAISPGLFITDINREFFTPEILKKFSASIPLDRPGQIHEIEALTLLLASNKSSSYITGSSFVIDGGMSAGIIH